MIHIRKNKYRREPDAPRHERHERVPPVLQFV